MSRKLWTEDEDRQLTAEVARLGTDDQAWEKIASSENILLQGKSAKQCRDRWFNHLDPQLLHSDWQSEDNRRLLSSHEKSGSRWKIIARQFPRRTDNSVKNQFFSLVRKSLRKARKSVSKNANTAEVNAIKPKVLSDLLSQSINLPPELLSSVPSFPEELKFFRHSPVQLRDFVSCFAFSKVSEQAVQASEGATRAVDFVLRSLEQQNKEYVRSKIKSKPTRPPRSTRAKMRNSRLPKDPPTKQAPIERVEKIKKIQKIEPIERIEKTPSHRAFTSPERVIEEAPGGSGGLEGFELDRLEFNYLDRDSSPQMKKSDSLSDELPFAPLRSVDEEPENHFIKDEF